MGFLNDLSDTLNRGAEITARTGKSIKLKAQLAEKKNQRNAACAKLGEAVVAQFKDGSQSIEGFEETVKAILEIDAKIEQIQAELDKVASDAAAYASAHVVDACPICGYHVRQGDKYCSRCGAKMPLMGDFPEDDDSAANAPFASEQVIDVDPVTGAPTDGEAASVKKPAWATNIPEDQIH